MALEVLTFPSYIIFIKTKTLIQQWGNVIPNFSNLTSTEFEHPADQNTEHTSVLYHHSASIWRHTHTQSHKREMQGSIEVYDHWLGLSSKRAQRRKGITIDFIPRQSDVTSLSVHFWWFHLLSAWTPSGSHINTSHTHTHTRCNNRNYTTSIFQHVINPAWTHSICEQ